MILIIWYYGNVNNYYNSLNHTTLINDNYNGSMTYSNNDNNNVLVG